MTRTRRRSNVSNARKGYLHDRAGARVEEGDELAAVIQQYLSHLVAHWRRDLQFLL
jgi:hypothetical protein